MSHICVIGLGQRWFSQWPIACSAPSHYLNQYWRFVDWTLRNKFQWNSNKNTNHCIHWNAFENVVCKITAILPRERFDNGVLIAGDQYCFLLSVTNYTYSHYPHPEFLCDVLLLYIIYEKQLLQSISKRRTVIYHMLLMRKTLTKPSSKMTRSIYWYPILL